MEWIYVGRALIVDAMNNVFINGPDIKPVSLKYFKYKYIKYIKISGPTYFSPGPPGYPVRPVLSGPTCRFTTRAVQTPKPDRFHAWFSVHPV